MTQQPRRAPRPSGRCVVNRLPAGLRAPAEVPQQAADHGRDPPGLPVRAPAPQPLLPVVPGLVVVHQAGEFGGIETEQVARQRTAHAVRGLRLGDRPEQALELFRLAALEHVGVAYLDAPDAVLAQGVGDLAALVGLAHQHRDVAALHRAVANPRAAFRRPRQERSDLGRRLAGRAGSRLPLRQLPRAIAFEQPEPQRCGVAVAFHCEARRPPRIRRRYRLERQFRQHEG